MYYEIYIDVLFLINLFMDFILLLLVKKVTKSPANIFWLFAGSCIGAFGICLLIALTGEITPAVWGQAAVGALMVKVGCRTKGWRQWIKSLFFLYIITFLMGGIFQALSYYTDIEGWIYTIFLSESKRAIGMRLFFMLGVGSYGIILLFLHLLERYKNRFSHIYEVILYHKGRKKKLLGFLDTGNQLKDPLSGKPVCIMNLNTAEQLLGTGQTEQIKKMLEFEEPQLEGKDLNSNIHYIPFHSIGKQNGILPGVTIDIMTIRFNGEGNVIRNPVLAVSKDEVSAKGDYQMILNPILIQL